MIDYAFIGARRKEARIRKNMTQKQLADYLCVERSGLSLELGKAPVFHTVCPLCEGFLCAMA